VPSHFLPVALNCTSGHSSLSISRPSSRCSWGIPVPDDPSQTIYVWLDALISYLSAVGYPENFESENSSIRCWPPDVQIFGKDILKFHAHYWPSFLMAADLPLPKQLFVHSHWLVNKLKMSKSRGNVICPFDAIRTLQSVDGLRYFLLKHGVPYEDGNFTIQKATEVINAELVNDLGNLVQRAVNPKLNPKQEFPKFDDQFLNTEAKDLIRVLHSLPEKVGNCYTDYSFNRGLEFIAETVREANHFFHTSQPWKKSNQELGQILFLAYETARLCAIYLQPISPEYSDRILSRLGINESERFLTNAGFADQNTFYTKRFLGKDFGIIWPRIAT